MGAFRIDKGLHRERHLGDARLPVRAAIDTPDLRHTRGHPAGPREILRRRRRAVKRRELRPIPGESVGAARTPESSARYAVLRGCASFSPGARVAFTRGLEAVLSESRPGSICFTACFAGLRPHKSARPEATWAQRAPPGNRSPFPVP